MKFEPFVMERSQSVWENQVEINLAESGVEPLVLGELLDGVSVDDTRLGYPQTNGTPELRDAISDLYPGTEADNIVVTNGTAEANYISVLTILEPGEEAIVMHPNYMQVWGLAQCRSGLRAAGGSRVRRFGYTHACFPCRGSPVETRFEITKSPGCRRARDDDGRIVRFDDG